MSRNQARILTGLTSILLFISLLMTAARAEQPGVLPITTKSKQARELYLRGMVKLENLHAEAAFQDFHKAVQLDPDFALAHIIISFPTVDPTAEPAEQVAARDRARAAKSKVSRGEQLFIDWISESSEGHMIPAIQAMNELLEQYPKDKHLLWLAGVWVENQQEISKAIQIFERAMQLDAKFAAPLNEGAYCYARQRMFDKAFDAMKRYTALLPNEPNPHDTYAEILRMAGKFDEALAEYRMSLKVDPGFVESQLGLADTYALMGEESRARSEYAIAISHARSKMQAAQWGLNSAITYVREHDYKRADNAFLAVAHQAHESDLPVAEAEAYRMMSAYQPESAAALQLLQQAEQGLLEKHKVPPAVLQQELAVVLRERVLRAAHDGNLSLAGVAVAKLSQMSESSHDQLITLAYHGAAGALLVAQGKYEDALSQLEEDDRNLNSLKLMVIANQNSGHSDAAEQISKKLANWNEPTLEHALIAPEFRPKETAGSSFRRM